MVCTELRQIKCRNAFYVTNKVSYKQKIRTSTTCCKKSASLVVWWQVCTWGRQRHRTQAAEPPQCPWLPLLTKRIALCRRTN